MKVFVVTSGAYSDYGINCIFSSRELAEAYLVAGRDANIEEYDVDEKVNYQCGTFYIAYIDLLDGKILDQMSYEYEHPRGQRAGQSSVLDHRNFPDKRAQFAGHLVGRVESYVSADHALKLAAEFRQSYLRNAAMHTPTDRPADTTSESPAP